MSTTPAVESADAPAPLLLQRQDVLNTLGLYDKLVHELALGGSIRKFRPNPAGAFGYYFAADVARIAARAFPVDWIDALPPDLCPEDFARFSGLSPHAFWTAIRFHTLAHRRTAHGVLVVTLELRRFV